MKYIVDAYNVIGQLDDIQLNDPDKVNKFLGWIQRNIKAGMHITGVFDGQNELVGFPMTEKRPGITIVHTSGQQSADDYIKGKISRLTDASNTIVVTSDRDILHHAKKHRVKTLTSPLFIQLMHQTPPQKHSKKSPRITDQHVDYWLNEFGEIND
ncbi:MAG: NYN domain-containing protein [Candidatus Marinamargulisbacteria bacterium]